MFRTELNINPSFEKINHQSKILTIGSCFSQVIGERLEGNKFQTLTNPFGTIFNPISIIRLLESGLKNDLSIINSPVQSQGGWFNYHLHSSFYANTESELKNKIAASLSQVHDRLKEADTLIITLGTAFVYKLNSDKQIVANCHKIPANNFIKELLTIEEIIKSFDDLLAQFKIYNLKFKIIVTVSPVRHTKDTLSLNTVSKSILRLACHELSSKFENVFYFPSYEIMMDDLRDYRFYKEDMIHPTEVAEEYIWNKFSEAYFDESTKGIVKEWSSVKKALEHKPFREDSEEHKKFLANLLERLKVLQNKIDVKKEIEMVSGKL